MYNLQAGRGGGRGNHQKHLSFMVYCTCCELGHMRQSVCELNSLVCNFNALPFRTSVVPLLLFVIDNFAAFVSKHNFA